MARKPKGEAKEHRIEVLVDSDLHAKIEAAARHLRLTVAAFIRLAAIEKMDRDDREKRAAT